MARVPSTNPSPRFWGYMLIKVVQFIFIITFCSTFHNKISILKFTIPGGPSRRTLTSSSLWAYSNMHVCTIGSITFARPLNTEWITNKRKRSNREAGTCRIPLLSYMPLPPPGGGQGFYADALASLKSSCSVFLDTSSEPILTQTREQARSTEHYYTHLASPPRAAPVR